MTAADRPAFGQVLAALGETYRAPFSTSQAEIYWRSLADQDLDAIRRAAGELVKTSKWLPKPSEIRDEIRRARRADGIDTRGPMPRAIAPPPGSPAEAETVYVCDCAICGDLGLVSFTDDAGYRIDRPCKCDRGAKWRITATRIASANAAPALPSPPVCAGGIKA